MADKDLPAPWRPSTEVVTAEAPPSVAPSSAALPGEGVQAAMSGMLQVSVAVFGDVVQSLLSDLSQVSSNMKDLSWLSRTQTLLRGEGWYQRAREQMLWWDRFLAQLPYPQLISDNRKKELTRLRAERTAAMFQARNRALEDHQVLVQQRLAAPNLSEEERDVLAQMYEDPDSVTWLVDPARYQEAALATLPELETPIPIVADDLNPVARFSGFQAIEKMRTHAALGQKAATMDSEITQILVQELGLSKKNASDHARNLTGIFWLAMRRALEAENLQLSTTIHFATVTETEDIHKQFGEELLVSWLHYLEQIPAPTGLTALGGRIRKLLGLGRPDRSSLQPSSAKLLTADSEDE